MEIRFFNCYFLILDLFCFVSSLMILIVASFEFDFSSDSKSLLVLSFIDRFKILTADGWSMESYFDSLEFYYYAVKYFKELIDLEWFLGFHSQYLLILFLRAPSSIRIIKITRTIRTIEILNIDRMGQMGFSISLYIQLNSS